MSAPSPDISRRRFVASAGLAATAVCLMPRRDRIAALKGKGKSLDEIVAAKPIAAYDAKWGKGFVSGDFFTKLVYAGV